MNPTVSSPSPSSFAYLPPTAGPHDRRAEFCARFRDERQRRNRSLIAISAATKLQASLLEAFERGDVSRWPKGIYRRAFFRDYVTAIGLPVNPHLAEFIELFPDAELPVSVVVGQPAPRAVRAPEVITTSFRITLAEDASPWTMRAPSAASFRRRVLLQQAGAAIADLALVALMALVISRWMSLWFAIAIVACVYYTLCTALLGRSLASTLLIRRDWVAAAYAATCAAAYAAAASAGSSVIRWSGLRFREARARMPELLALVERAAHNGPRLRDSLSRLTAHLPRIPSFRMQSRRERELAELRRRRLEAAERPAKKVSEVLS